LNLETMLLADIRPYKRNPRRNDRAVDAVAESIRQCQYVAPIVVDERGVILAGHTRWKALARLGRTEAEVVVRPGLSEEQKRKYRLLDNKTAELAEWDPDLLAAELDGLDLDGLEFDWGLASGVTPADGGADDPDAAGDADEVSEEYRAFVDKFKPKLTTDDCYTPDTVYQTVRDWALEHYGLDGAEVIRPFWPGGNYQSVEYPAGGVVIDNPPFSILSEICRWYDERGVRYFLFAPTLTLFSSASGSCNYVPCGVAIIYANGATVNTSFVTNLGEWKIEMDPELFRRVKSADDQNRAESSVELPGYVYPDAVLTSSAYRLAKYGQSLRLRAEDVIFVRALDAQRETGKSIYGSGFLLSARAAAERAAAERAAAERAAAERAAAERAAAERAAAHVWVLSDRERELIRRLGDGTGPEGA